ncbi:ParA family protein [Magnetofaba australis]|uniref:Putative chromosome partitioning protein n=1 Tax=Magnetofaba australis IT-1 TaxID=1434232 RepID=A0A1Y2KAK9_9PROT|nr:ParA family protein [Magnetofaba australis]OSM08670.1 putative chromosome partitioning protein [Magnetofaba australis IT-1]
MAQSVIAVINQKGGVGKTTTAVSLAACLHSKKSPALVLDADPQGSAVGWSRMGDGFGFAVEAVDLTSDGAARALKQTIASHDGHVVIDCPPEAKQPAAVAAALADLVLIPVSASGLDVMATKRATDLVLDARSMLGGERPRALLVATKFDRTAIARDMAQMLRGFIGEADFDQLNPDGPAVAATRIANLVPLRECTASGLTIVQYQPKGKSAQEYRALAKEVLKQIKQGE